MNYENLCKNWKDPDPQYDYLFSMPKGKINSTVKLHKGDSNSAILCKEPYAQELYDLMFKDASMKNVSSKDLNKNEIYDVYAKSYNESDKLVTCIEVNSGAEIFVPMSEVKTVDLDSGKSFKLMVTRAKDGFNYASRKKCEKAIDLKTLKEYLDNNTDFDVTIKRLVNGGFFASFNNNVECFLPGAHAAANVIYDFESYLGKTIRVCVDNYDPVSDLFVVSHKKYISKILPDRLQDIKFGEKYKGILTSDPTKYGIFIEFAINPEYGSIFTGLIKSTDIPQGKKYKRGDEVEFYVSNVIVGGRNTKINLTFNEKDINEENLAWQKYKTELEGKELDFRIEGDKIVIIKDGEDKMSINIDYESNKKNIEGKKKAILSKIDIINKSVGLELM